MTDLSKSRTLRAAIIAALDSFATDPNVMSAVETLAEGCNSIDTMLDYLWRYDEVFSSPFNSVIYLGCSKRKQQAVRTITGRSWTE